MNKEICVRPSESEKELFKEKSMDAIKGIETENIMSMELDIEHRDDDYKYLTVTIRYI